jgi:predicted NACHT family NTPase
VIITCRIAAQQYRFPGFTDIEIADFNPKQIEEFAKKWFVAVDRNSEEAGKTKVVQFIEKLNYPENMPVREIAITPILLSLTCSVFQAKTEFPSNRVQLYEEGLEVLLSKWDKSKGIKRDEIYKDLYLQQKIELLTQIASITFEKNHYFFKQDEVQQTIGGYLRTLHNTQAHLATLKQDSEAVLKSVQVQHGLLVERARRIYSFSHLTFQEYFTAKALIDSFNSGDLEQSVSHVTKKNWREVFLMAAGMVGSADNLLRAMKQRIDAVVADDDLQKFLDWVNQKSLLVQQFPYKLSAVRAFHFAIAHSTNLARNLRLACTLDPTFCHKRDSCINSDPDLYCVLVTACDLIRDLPRNFISENDFNFVYIRDRDIYRILKDLYYSLLPDTELAQSLHQLKNQLPEPYVDTDKFTAWWQTKGEDWSEQLRIIIVKYPHLGNYWQINEQHKKLLKQYYDANKLLVDCLNSGCEVTPEVRKEIEDTLLLPITEIKKRRSKL